MSVCSGHLKRVLLCPKLWTLKFSKFRAMSQIRKNLDPKNDTEAIRNIGILAHIDAGKTTTTERMLYYSGTIRHMGEVHHGNTVTDFMQQERNRGITITSAAITFCWGKYKFNLIDTPGHIDFTMEVEQTLNVLDGAIVVLDASAGVEAQTCTVWAQAERHDVPRIIYVNKMDRVDADLSMCIASLKSRLGASPVLLQIPIKEPGSKGLLGIIDLVTLEQLSWEKTSTSKNMHRLIIPNDSHLAEQARKERCDLIEQLTDIDDELAETVIRKESAHDISSQELQAAVRRVTLNQLAVPVLCGSSYHNAGVQPLMDAVGLYLPSPNDRSPSSLVHSFGDSLCARVFKVRHDEHMGAITFLRVYSGTLSKGQKLYNMRLQSSEQSSKLMIPYADEFTDILDVTKGNICAVSGLKFSNSGDVMTSGLSVAQAAKKTLMKLSSLNEKQADETLGIGSTIPEPVFFCSIEPPSQAYQTALERALQELQREDPSLRVTNDPDTGQTVLAGMGELHLEVIKERIISEYKIKVELGPMQIAYRETLANSVTDSHSINQKIGSGTHSVKVTLSLEPDQSSNQTDLKLDRSPESTENLRNLHPKQLLAIKRGIENGMCHGPLIGCPVVNVTPTLHWIEIGRGTSETVLAAAVTQCVHKLLKQGGTELLEPVVVLEVVTQSDCLSAVMADLSRRRAEIQEITERKNQKIVVALAPLAELMGYSTALRTITSGGATFTMEFHSLQTMSPVERHKAIRNITGFDPITYSV